MNEYKNDGKVEYLQLIQEPICRMSTNAAIFKGFSATVVSGATVATYNMHNKYIIAVSLLMVCVFALLDIYYLQIERKYRFLYNQVRLNKHDIDFSMELTSDSEEIKKAEAGLRDCVQSKFIWCFYLSLIVSLLFVWYKVS